MWERVSASFSKYSREDAWIITALHASLCHKTGGTYTIEKGHV